MKIYSCSPFMNEFELLNLKVSEEADVVDGIFVIESNQTLHCRPKPLNLKERKDEYYHHPKLHLCFVEDQFSPRDHYNNDTIQKDSVLKFFDYGDDDVIICADIDEITKKEEIPYVVEQATKHGFVKLKQHLFYYKLNLRRSPLKGWKSAFAITGKKMREFKGKIHKLRRTNGEEIETDGKHFSYLMTPEMIAYKIKNAGHPEFMGNKYTNLQLIEERINNQIDPFERSANGALIKLEKVDIDESYPSTILNNLDKWAHHIA